jgi:hypothetical protein
VEGEEGMTITLIIVAVVSVIANVCLLAELSVTNEAVDSLQKECDRLVVTVREHRRKLEHINEVLKE